uniref:Uncharacterized protein n=1 Tax=Palpitomonas bilix TaxID=652834 RepID=A0A7S3CWZ8_9EUKA
MYFSHHTVDSCATAPALTTTTHATPPPPVASACFFTLSFPLFFLFSLFFFFFFSSLRRRSRTCILPHIGGSPASSLSLFTLTCARYMRILLCIRCIFRITLLTAVPLPPP